MYIIRLVIEQQIYISSYYWAFMKMQIKQWPLPKFWFNIDSKYSLLSQKTVKMLLPFATDAKQHFQSLSNECIKPETQDHRHNH